MSDRLSCEVAVVGGGPAGMTTALYTTRLGHRTVVLEKEGGRHAAVSHVHNLLGVSEDVSGRELAAHAAEQLVEYGGEYHKDAVTAVERTGDGGFAVDATHTALEADRVVFATGFTDVEPSVPGLQEFTGRGLHYCLHCDAYSLGDGPVFVLGHGEEAAHVAMLMLNFTTDVDLLLDGRDPEWSDETERQLRAHPVDRVEEEAVGAFPREEHEGERSEPSERASGEHQRPASSAADQREATEQASSEGVTGAAVNRPADSWLGGLSFADGTEREYLGGFAMYGKRYNTALPESLGCALADDGALAVDENYETSVDGAYGVGDLTHGQNQTVVALGDGARAGIALHKDLRRYPRPPDEPDDVEASEIPGAPDALRARMRLVRSRDTHAGLRGPEPDR
ncbi:NAD(P)/FAD-dependent oxidoreductase [Halobacterium zhouii]|uniref:NAD(P)/FAD-dependent oxidoreductase n=1 Tax=Halobacterium zhouii TaxID=2902624 RepID=UPI001E5BED50|nr:NAD(P)/FAD-dependent oxidoreductase [Halobacterium zhouii]